MTADQLSSFSIGTAEQPSAHCPISARSLNADYLQRNPACRTSAMWTTCIVRKTRPMAAPVAEYEDGSRARSRGKRRRTLYARDRTKAVTLGQVQHFRTSPRKVCTAFSSMALKTGSDSPGED